VFPPSICTQEITQQQVVETTKVQQEVMVLVLLVEKEGNKSELLMDTLTKEESMK
jgi:hypothetical protein